MTSPRIRLRRRPDAIAAAACLLLLAVAVRLQAAETPSATARQAGDEVLTLLSSGDVDLQRVALDRIRHGLDGAWFTRLIAERLPTLASDLQAAVLLALADRGDAEAVPAASRVLAATREPRVRAAALAVLGRLGGPADVASLVAALAADGPQRDAASRGLMEIAGPAAAEAIRTAAAQAPVAARPAVIDILAERRDRQSLPLLAAAAVDDDAAVRRAAMKALARFGGAAEIPAMMNSLLMATGDDRKAAELAIAAACTTGLDATRATTAAVAGYEAADEAARATLLPALARVGGPQVMAIVEAMLADPAQRPRGLDALSKWPDATVKDRLLDLVGTTNNPEERDLLLGTLIRIAPLPDNKLNDGEKLELLKRTMGLCQRTADKARVLERANAIRTIETFRFVVPFLDDPALAEPACASIVELAHHQKLRDAHKQEFTAALDKVLRTTKNEELVERATRYKAGRTWDRGRKG